MDRFCDDLGPCKVIQLYEPRSGLKGIVVVDNIACGPSIGGVRMASDVSTEEVFRLARAMTLKNAMAGLPHGGGKAGIVADPKKADKRRLIRAFARAIRDLTDYIPGPDMGTDETSMAWIHDEIGRSVGLPAVFGGIPLDEIGATGYGIAECAETAAPFCELTLQGASVAIEGFGNVGRHAARFLAEKGCQLVAASDSRGAVHDPDGLDLEELSQAKEEHGTVTAHRSGKTIDSAHLFEIPCDILIPAARPDCIHAGNAAKIRARLILQGANIPATLEAEAVLHERRILIVPDFVANAGGVICAAVEYGGGSQSEAFVRIAQQIRRNSAEVLRRARDENVAPRTAAVSLARERVLEAMKYR